METGGARATVCAGHSVTRHKGCRDLNHNNGKAVKVSAIMFPLMFPFIKCPLYVASMAVIHHTPTKVCAAGEMGHLKFPAGSQAATVHSSPWLITIYICEDACTLTHTLTHAHILQICTVCLLPARSQVRIHAHPVEDLIRCQIPQKQTNEQCILRGNMTIHQRDSFATSAPNSFTQGHGSPQ